MKFTGRNIHIGKNVKIGDGVKIGDDTVIYDNVEIGANSVICNNCVLGEPLNDYYHNPEYKNPTLKIGEGALIRSHTILYAGSVFGENLQTGHRVTVREYAVVGCNCSIGSYADIQGACEIGNYVRLHSYVNIGQGARIGNFVFISPFTVLTNDPTPPSNTISGVTIGDYSQITTSCVLLPGAVVGCNCMVAAHSCVGGKFEDNSFISGSPAKRICDIRKAPIFNYETKKRHYPWQYNFDRNMPWAGIGYDKWLDLCREDDEQ
jgi:acetyltransferase-like isoleucine patch superfamily enzyme